MIPLLLNPPFKVGPAAFVTHQFCGDIPICMAIYLIWTYDVDNHNGHNVYMCLCMHLFWDVHGIQPSLAVHSAIHGYSGNSFPHSIRACQYPHVNISHLQGSTSSGKVGEESTHLPVLARRNFLFLKTGGIWWDDWCHDCLQNLGESSFTHFCLTMSDHCSFTNGIGFFHWAKWSWNKGKIPWCLPVVSWEEEKDMTMDMKGRTVDRTISGSNISEIENSWHCAKGGRNVEYSYYIVCMHFMRVWRVIRYVQES